MNDIKMPQPLMLVQTQNMTVGELILSYHEEGKTSSYPWAKRFVMGFPLPDWQRPLVWNAEQKERFITSLWTGIDVGSYMVNTWRHENNSPALSRFSDMLLDGQQRLYAIQQYISSGLAVEDENGIPRLWEALPVVEKRRFKMRTFARATIDCFDEAMLRRLYDLHNFGGTPHLETERASS